MPWTSGYEPFAVTLGWLVMISLILTAASGGLRHFLPGWRIVHALAYLTFGLGLAHGLLAGSYSGSPWALAFYAATLLAVAWTLSRRFKRPSRPPPRGTQGVDHEGSIIRSGQRHQRAGERRFSPTRQTHRPGSRHVDKCS